MNLIMNGDNLHIEEYINIKELKEFLKVLAIEIYPMLHDHVSDPDNTFGNLIKQLEKAFPKAYQTIKEKEDTT